MTFRKSTLALALAAALTGGMVFTAQARPGDFHHGPRGPRPCQESVYQALTPEKQAQYDAIMREFTEKTAPLRDQLAAVLGELRRMEAGGGVDDELLATIRLITVTLDGMRED